MNAKKLIAAASAACLALNGCTFMLWGHNPATSSYSTYQDAGHDQVLAFGRAQRSSGELKQGSLVMMGERYWYALKVDHSEALLPVLNAKLSRRYDITSSDKEQKNLIALPVTLQDKGKHFSSDFCLSYTPANQQERDVLTELKFTAPKESPEHYSRCFYAYGSVFAKPDNAQTDYRFEQPVPVSLRLQHDHTSVNGVNLIHNILWTPFTLALDAAGAVVALPLITLGAITEAASK